VVLGHGDPLRHPGPGGARRRADPGLARRPRQHRQRRPRPAADRHVQQPAARVPVRREPVRRAAGRHPQRRVLGRRRRRLGRRRRRRLQSPRRQRGPQPRLRVRFAWAAGARRVRGRNPHPVQEPAVPERRRTDLGLQRGAPSAPQWLPGQLDARGAGQLGLPGAVRHARGVDRHAARPRARADADPHQPRAGAPAGHGLAVPRYDRGRPQCALGHHAESLTRRRHQPRLLAGRVGRGPAGPQRAVRAVLPREAAVLPRRPRAVRHAQPPDLHAAHRRSGRGAQAGRTRGVHQRGDAPRRGQRAPFPHGRPPRVRRRAAAHRPGPPRRARPGGDHARGRRGSTAASSTG